ncbi:MAG: LicD family protein [Ruminococcus sp.]|nr:LicD family protein [Ruminococcus sp.]
MERKKISQSELKRIQLQILDNVVEYCEKNDIHYWLDSGTLLGAIRHKGYIPWDDDIDIGMLRIDYDKFINGYNQEKSNYCVHCLENDSDFYLPFAKVYDSTTELYEPDEKGFKLCINIDIFVFDNAPDDDLMVEKMFNKRDLLRKRFMLYSSNHRPSGVWIIRIIKYMCRYIYRLFPDNSIRKMIDNSKKYSDTETKRVGNFIGYSKMVCNKRVFDSYIDVEFEGKQYKAPVGYDEWLRALYGDYMRLPPVEERVSHHKFIAYRNSEDCAR